MVIETRKYTPELLSDKELALIKLIREMPYGRFEVMVKESKPIRVEKLRESIDL